VSGPAARLVAIATNGSARTISDPHSAFRKRSDSLRATVTTSRSASCDRDHFCTCGARPQLR